MHDTISVSEPYLNEDQHMGETLASGVRQIGLKAVMVGVFKKILMGVELINID